MARVPLRLFGCFLCVALSGCASKSVELISDPSGAEIQTIGNEVLGTTPVTLKEEALEKATSADGLIAVRFVATGFLPQTLLAEVRGNDSFRIQLLKMDDIFFKKYIQRDFAEEHNAMIREILNIQALIRTKKYDEAEKLLLAYQDKYPTVAMGQLQLANLALVRRDRVTARRYLLQAQALDPLDPVITRMLGSTNDVKTILGAPPPIASDFSKAPAVVPAPPAAAPVPQAAVPAVATPAAAKSPAANDAFSDTEGAPQ